MQKKQKTKPMSTFFLKKNIRYYFDKDCFKYGLLVSFRATPFCFFATIAFAYFSNSPSLQYSMKAGFILSASLSFVIAYFLRFEQKQLIQSNKDHERKLTLEVVVASYNHEINNPLTIILGNIEKLKRKNIEYKELECIKMNTQRIINQLNKISDLKNYKSIEYSDFSKTLDLRNSETKKL